MLPFLFVLFTNHWIWLIFSSQTLTFALCVASTVLLYLSLTRKNKKILISLMLIYLLLIAQFIRTTQARSLGHRTNLEIDLQTKRLNSYHLTSKLPYYLEGQPITLVVYKMQNNLTNFFDINYYFFGSYPRENQTPGEFNKFPFFFLPLFLIGVYKLALHPKKILITTLLLFNALLISLIGDKNHLGIFINFPLMLVIITSGLHQSINYVYSKIT